MRTWSDEDVYEMVKKAFEDGWESGNAVGSGWEIWPGNDFEDWWSVNGFDKR